MMIIIQCKGQCTKQINDNNTIINIKSLICVITTEWEWCMF